MNCRLLARLRVPAGLRLNRQKSEQVTEAKPSEIKEEEENKPVVKERKDYELAEFFDFKENWGKTELTVSKRPGRSWNMEELRLKSSSDLHKLWYVLLKERNMLLTMEQTYKVRHLRFPNPERLDRVDESMANLEAIVHERNDAFLRLETGDGASPPERTITSFAGFTYPEPASEHYEPFEVTGRKEYEVPLLDEQAYLMQKLWKEKERLKVEMDLQDEYLLRNADRPTNLGLLRGGRRHFDRVEDLPKNVVARRRERMEMKMAGTEGDAL